MLCPTSARRPEAVISAPTVTIRGRLIVLVLLSVVPAAVLATAFLLSEYWQERERIATGTTATARALALAVDQRIAMAQASLSALATSRLLWRQDWEEFHAQAREVAQQQDFAVIGVVDPALVPLMNTMQAPGDLLRRPGAADHIAGVFEAARPVVTDVFIGSLQQTPSVAVAVPAIRHGEVAYALVGGLEPSRLWSMLRGQKLPPHWVATVVDRNGHIVARSAEHERFLGAKVRDALAERIAQAREGALEGTSLAGLPVVSVFSTAPASGWRVVIGIPRAELTAGLYRRLALVAGGTTLLLLTSLLLAWRLRGRLVDTLDILKDQARRLGRGEPIAAVDTGYLETEELGAVFRQASHDLGRAKDALVEKGRALELSEGRLAALVESALDAIVSCDEARRIVLFNRAAEKMFGYGREQVLGRPLDLLVPPNARDAHWARMQAFAASEATSRRMRVGVLRGLRADGSQFPLEAAFSQVATPGGKLFTAIVRDLSDKVRAEAELHAVRAEASAMREADKKRVARELHDDVVQTLAAIKHEAGWLLRQQLPTAQEERARRLIALSDDGVVALRRIAADLRPVALDELGFAAALHDLVDTFVERTGVPCELHMEDGLALQDPHATEVFRLVQEALSNIAKHARATRVAVELTQSAGELLLRVRDDGVGFDTAAPRRRSAMGLAGLRERVEILEGTLFIDSRPGAGATLEVRAPAFRGAAGA